MRLLAFVLLLAPLTVSAQDLPRWGRLSDADRALADWPTDPDARAVVLADVGQAKVEIGRNVTYRMERHSRVKVLHEDGYDMGEISLTYHGDDRIFRVRGQTFVPDGDGDYRRVELDGDDIFDEEIGPERRQVRFSMPALQPGAIFEYSYVFESDGITLLPDWHFQDEEPTVLSVLRLELPVYFEYVTLSQGHRFEQLETEEIDGFDYDAGVLRWVARNVPALRDEPYTTTEADFVERIGFQLRRIHRPDGFVDDVLDDWSTLAETLRDNDYFGRRHRRNRRVRELAETVEGTVAEKAEALYDLVRTEFVWDGRGGGIFARRDLDEVVETREGTAAELAHLLLALYAEAEVPAHPVVLSTRSNGRAVTAYPIVNQFNKLLVWPRVPGSGVTLLDPTSPHRPYGQVGVEALNGDAWVVDYERPRWITFRAPGGTATTTLVQGEVAEDGTLTGELQLRLAGYAAFDARERLAEAESGPPAAADDAVAETADADEDVEIDVTEVRNVDAVAERLEVDAAVTATAAEVIDGEMYLTPFVAMQLDENPFERETRSFPVDFAYPSTRTYVADLGLPAGWEAVDLPQPLMLTIPSRSVRYQRFVVEDAGRLKVRAVLTIARSQVTADEYPALRDLYDEIVAAESEAFVIARVAEPEPTEAGATDAAADDTAPDAASGEGAEAGDEGGR